jgi:hypothetical protein
MWNQLFAKVAEMGFWGRRDEFLEDGGEGGILDLRSESHCKQET